MSSRRVTFWSCIGFYTCVGLCISVAVNPAFAADPAPATGKGPLTAALTAVSASLHDMAAAANAHDVDRHVGFYAHDSAVTLIFNGEPIVGWQAIYDKQREWWRDGKTDVVYTLQGAPDIRVFTPTLALSTILMQSRRTLASGEVSQGRLAVSALWQKRTEGWRVIYSHESSSHP